MILFDDEFLQGVEIAPRPVGEMIALAVEKLGEVGMHPDSCECIRDAIMRGILPITDGMVQHSLQSDPQHMDSSEDELPDAALQTAGLEN